MGNTHTRVQPSETKGNTCAKGHDASSTKIQETLHDMLKSDETLTSSQIIAHLNANVTKNQIFHKEDCFLKNMDRITSDTIQAQWCSLRENCFPEYEEANAVICLEKEWIISTRLTRYLRLIRTALEKDPALKKQLQHRKHFRQIAIRLVQLGYQLPSEPGSETAAAKTIDPMCGNNVLDSLLKLFDRIGSGKQPYMAYACSLFADNTHDSDLIVAKVVLNKHSNVDAYYPLLQDCGRSEISEICDRAHRCESAVRQAFNILIASSFQLLELEKKQEAEKLSEKDSEKDSEKESITDNNLDSDPDPESLQNVTGAMRRLQACFEDFMDDHKEKAFNSSIVQPARFYFDLVGDRGGRDHVNIHGMNWYLALLHATLGVQLPILPKYSDGDKIGVIPFWRGLTPAAVEAFHDPAHFGRDFEGISTLKGTENRKRMLKGHVHDDLFGRLPRDVGNEALNRTTNSKKRQRFAWYAKHFAYFFSREFLVKKCFETLNAESKPEHMGFRKACDTMYEIYRYQWGISAETLVEYAYTDDWFIDLDLVKVSRFFAWLGVIKKTPADIEYLSVVPHPWMERMAVNVPQAPLYVAESNRHQTNSSVFNMDQDEKENEQSVRQESAKQDGTESKSVVGGSKEDEVEMFIQVCPLCEEPSENMEVVCAKCALISKSTALCSSCGVLKEFIYPVEFFDEDTDPNLNMKEAESVGDSEMPLVCLDCKLIRELQDVDESEEKSYRDVEPRGVNIGHGHEAKGDMKLDDDMEKEDDKECPICMEHKEDITPLPHWNPTGNVSAHKMCGSCRDALRSNECPFCKETISKDAFLEFIQDFVTLYTSTAKTDPNAMAAVLERWQMLEMEVDGNYTVICRLARLIIIDEAFSSLIKGAVTAKKEWLRDIAGVIFRFWGLIEEGSVTLDDAQSRPILEAVAVILSPLEVKKPAKLCGHFYGALYMQVLVPWLCAWNNGQPSDKLKQLVYRVARAIIHVYRVHKAPRELKREVQERVHIQYIEAAQVALWGGKEHDLMQQNFYK